MRTGGPVEVVSYTKIGLRVADSASRIGTGSEKYAMPWYRLLTTYIPVVSARGILSR